MSSFIQRYVAYIKDNPQGYWFKRKLYGWGWTPATWQGWAVTALYVGLLVLFAFSIDESSPSNEVFATFVLPAFFLTGLFIRVAYKTGESPRWQWGLPKEEEDKK